MSDSTSTTDGHGSSGMKKRFRRLLRMTEVEAKTGVHSSTIYRRVKKGQFPKPVRLFGPPGERSASRWDVDDLEAWHKGQRKW